MDENTTTELPSVTEENVAAKEPNQGEGDRISAKKYDEDAEKFIAEGRVPVAAREARAFVDADPAGAAKAERDAKHGPGSHPIDAIVSKGKEVLDKVIHAIKK